MPMCGHLQKLQGKDMAKYSLAGKSWQEKNYQYFHLQDSLIFHKSGGKFRISFCSSSGKSRFCWQMVIYRKASLEFRVCEATKQKRDFLGDQRKPRVRKDTRIRKNLLFMATRLGKITKTMSKGLAVLNQNQSMLS